MIEATIDPIRDASRRIVRELGFMRPTLAGTDLPPSAVHALIEIGRRGSLTALELGDILNLEKSSVSRMVAKLLDAGQLTRGLCSEDGRAKPLSLTPKGEDTLSAIDGFARAQVGAALECVPAEAHGTLRDGLVAYADALGASRAGRRSAPSSTVAIAPGYRPGLLGRAVEIQALYYAQVVGFGAVFEAKIAAEMAEFIKRLERPANQLWVALASGAVMGFVAIDGESETGDTARLRWFIVDEGQRGKGVGRRLLEEALLFCDRQGFRRTHLWTFRGLDAARKLYETHGFALAMERHGRQWGSEVVEQEFIREGRRSLD